MSNNPAGSDFSFGYLSTWESPEHGCLGGYLVVSVIGRPLEFHCTAPVKTSRAQQILYGPTLWPYVLGEQIGGTLLTEAQLKPTIVLVDHPAVLGLRARFDRPMVRLLDPKQEACGPLAAADETDAGLQLDGYTGEVAPGPAADRALVTESLTALARYIDLAEPFERIREAIREAQRFGEAEQNDVQRGAA